MSSSNDAAAQLGDVSKIHEWQSIITLIVFVLTNINVLFPFHIPLPVPRPLSNAVLDALSSCRIISPRSDRIQHDANREGVAGPAAVQPTRYVWVHFPMNFLTAPLIADLFLLAILAIGRDEVYAGTIGANSIQPIDIMAFFITLAYIAISIDASGLIRYLAFKVLQLGGKVGHRLFFYLYAFFFILGSFIGNDPIILTGTAFLAYMTRVSSNIVHPRAWIHTQFAVANIASAILVSSNPTNLVLASAFNIKFIDYTANMIVPVVITAIVLFPFLLFIIFADERLIPISIKMHELPEEVRARKPVNPNIPNARGNAEEEENQHLNDEQGKILSLEEIMNPFLDKGGAFFGASVMAVTLVALLGLNASSEAIGPHPVFYVTVPAAFVMACWDLAFGWIHRKETREIARNGRNEVERARAERKIREEAEQEALALQDRDTVVATEGVLTQTPSPKQRVETEVDLSSTRLAKLESQAGEKTLVGDTQISRPPYLSRPAESSVLQSEKGADLGALDSSSGGRGEEQRRTSSELELENELEQRVSRQLASSRTPVRPTLVSKCAEGYRWAQETFPTTTAVFAHLPFALVPFAFEMFVLVQALVSKGWVPVFAYGWDHWVNKTGTVGAIGGMGFLAVILCNFAGTNIGTTILLSRVVQSWQEIHRENGIDISDRTFWATVYAMALGVNYGAFSTAFSASLAGLLWRDILARKHIHVKALDFARVNLPIIAIAMSVGLAILVGEVYIMRTDKPYSL